jgi:hypothetical protein
MPIPTMEEEEEKTVLSHHVTIKEEDEEPSTEEDPEDLTCPCATLNNNTNASGSTSLAHKFLGMLHLWPNLAPSALCTTCI